MNPFFKISIFFALAVAICCAAGNPTAKFQLEDHSRFLDDHDLSRSVEKESENGNPNLFEDAGIVEAGRSIRSANDSVAEIKNGEVPLDMINDFGGLKATVFPPDGRIRITATNRYPWRAHAFLEITARDGRKFSGTGWFACPDTLVTAGHVVYIRGKGASTNGWAKSIKVSPGRNGNSSPYGTFQAKTWYSVKGWTRSGKPDFDYGAIKLSSDVGRTTGWFGHWVLSKRDLVGKKVHLSGYPGDKPRGTQWYHSEAVSRVTKRRVYYTADTYGGQSGSAVYRIIGGKRYAVAVHAYGGRTENSGTRITQAVSKNINDWCKL